MPTHLTQSFFARDTITVARELVGCKLRVSGKVGGEVSGRIVEVEAYEGENDPASHACRGRTPRSEIMFGPAGFAYVYLIYGMHHCLNFVTQAEGTAGAVLIRALEPLSGLEVMAQRRGLDPTNMRMGDLCAGPGRLCQACGITRDCNGMPLFPEPGGSLPADENRFQVYPGAGPSGGPEATARIGISKATTRLLRFIYPGSEFLSG